MPALLPPLLPPPGDTMTVRRDVAAAFCGAAAPGRGAWRRWGPWGDQRGCLPACVVIETGKTEVGCVLCQAQQVLFCIPASSLYTCFKFAVHDCCVAGSARVELPKAERVAAPLPPSHQHCTHLPTISTHPLAVWCWVRLVAQALGVVGNGAAIAAQQLSSLTAPCTVPQAAIQGTSHDQ